MNDATPDARRIADRTVSPVGFGAMRLGLEGRPDPTQAIRTIHAALDAGVQLIDTAMNYCLGPSEFGYCEAMVARGLREWSGDSDSILVVCKGGVLRSQTEQVLRDGSPENLRRSCEISLRALGVESIGVYMLHAIDPNVPIMESLGALGELKDSGKIQHIGVSNIGRRQLAEVIQSFDVVAIENRLSLWEQASLPAAEYCAAHQIALLAWGPLGSGDSAPLLNQSAGLARIAAEKGVSAAQVAIAWVLARASTAIPIPGARRPETILDSVASQHLTLNADEVRRLEAEIAAPSA